MPVALRSAFKYLAYIVVLIVCVVPPVWSADNTLSASATMAYDTYHFGGELFSEADVNGSREGQLRRLKLSTKYTYNDFFSGKIATKYNLSKSRFVLDDAYVTLDFASTFAVMAGQFKEPFGLENQQGFSNQYLMERSIATNALTFGRSPGINLLAVGEHWRWDIAAMYIDAESSDYNSATAYVSRLTFSPLDKKKYFVHFGAGFSTRGSVERKYDIDAELIAHGVGNLIHSANIEAKNIHAGNLEFAGRYGPFVLQSEVLFQEVVDNDNVSHQLGGYYTSLLWNIMGKSRRYKNGEVEFVESKTHGLELALRYSMADVEAHRDGDVGEVVSIALNYYARNALRLSLQYERAELTTFNPKDWDTYVKGDSISARLQLML